MHLRNVIPILIVVLSPFYAVDSFAVSFSALTVTPAAFSPLSNSASTTTAASYLLSDASTVTVTISGPLPGSSIVRTILDEIVYCDDFADENIAGWSKTALDKWSIKTDGIRLNVLTFSYHESDWAGRIVYGSDAWSDYAVEADVKLVCGGQAGIIFRASDIGTDLNQPNNYYQFIIDDSGQVRLERINSTVSTAIVSVSRTVERNKWYKLKIAVTGSTVLCYFDSIIVTLINTSTPLNISSGRVGLMTQTTSFDPVDSAYFDNFKVYKLGQVWDGKKDNGAFVDEGTYTFKVSARDLATGATTAETFAFVQVDTTAPTAVTDLSATIDGTTSPGEVKLTWTVPFDAFGINGYIVKYATFSINNSNWNSQNVSTFTQSWTPLGVGSEETRTVNGLANATTYFFAIKCLDGAQNASPVSNSPAILTPAPPVVNVIKPSDEALGNGESSDPAAPTGYCIIWTYSDPNDDILTFEIRLSTDEGANYSILIASGLPGRTTSYQMETLNYEDSDPYHDPQLYYKIKVTAFDSHGLSGSGNSAGFGIYNYDYVQEVTLTAPNGDILGKDGFWMDERTITWTIKDKNSWETQYITCDIYISTVGLVNSTPGTRSPSWQQVAAGITGTSYKFNTNERNPDGSSKYPNSRTCAISIVAHGVSNPWRRDNSWESDSSDISNSTFTINNTNKPPNSFSLISPSKGSIIGFLRPAFSWAATTDPDANDNVTYYELWYSTAANFSVKTIVSSVTTNSWASTSDFQDGKRYYWKVQAFDKFATNAWSAETDWYFEINRSAKTSYDGRVTVCLNGILPTSDSYVYVGTVTITQSPALLSAKQKLNQNSSSRNITDTAYEIKIMQNGAVVNTDINATVSIDCPYGVDSNGYVDFLGFPAKYLRIARLDENENRWVLAAQDQTVNVNAARKATVSVNLSRFSTYSLIAYAAPDSILFSVNNFPNPFNPNTDKTTTITYGLTKDSKVTLEIFNLVGDLVYEKTISNPLYDAMGMTKNNELWDSANGDGMKVATGMYLCRITAEPRDGSSKVVQIRKIGVKNK